MGSERNGASSSGISGCCSGSHELAQNNSQLAAFSDLKAVACGDYIYVFGKTDEGNKIKKVWYNS